MRKKTFKLLRFFSSKFIISKMIKKCDYKMIISNQHLDRYNQLKRFCSAFISNSIKNIKMIIKCRLYHMSFMSIPFTVISNSMKKHLNDYMSTSFLTNPLRVT